MDAPTRKHKPIVSVSDYDQIDGQYANNTDALALSFGFAQYNKSNLPQNQRELSLKVWRMGERGWLRMSEELPIHRNLDLTKLFLETLIECRNLHENNRLINESLTPHFDNGSLQDIINYYDRNKDILKPRLKEIRDLLNKMEL